MKTTPFSKSRPSKRNPFLMALAPVLTAGLFASAAHAQVLHTINEPFDSPLGGVPADWNLIWNGGAGPNNGIAEITEFGPSDSLTGFLQERTVGTRGASGNSALYYAGSSGPVSNGVIDHFSASVIFQVAGGSSDRRGMLGRVQSQEYNNIEGYWANVTPSGDLRLNRDPVSNVSHGTELDHVTLSESLTANTDYLMTFSAIGSQLSASVYAWDSNTNDFTDLLGSVSEIDTTYAEGLFGYRVALGSANRRVYWRDAEIHIIPEPGTALLGSFGLLLLLRRQFRLSRRELA